MIVERAFSININQQIQETNFSLAVKHYKLIRGSSRFKYMGESRGFLYRSIKLQTIFHGKLNPYWDQIRYRLDYVGGYLMNREYQILKNSNASEVNMVVKENKMTINEILDVASRSFTELRACPKISITTGIYHLGWIS
jgi:hypothetical protein